MIPNEVVISYIETYKKLYPEQSVPVVFSKVSNKRLQVILNDDFNQRMNFQKFIEFINYKLSRK